MILGLGNDIIEIDRIQSNIQRYKQKFLDRIFTFNEQEYCRARKEPAIHFAGRFAAKEAVVKALGTGFRKGISWQDIEIVNDSQGKPQVGLSPSAAAFLGHPKLLVTISHCRSYAAAVAIWIA